MKKYTLSALCITTLFSASQQILAADKELITENNNLTQSTSIFHDVETINTLPAAEAGSAIKVIEDVNLSRLSINVLIDTGVYSPGAVDYKILQNDGATNLTDIVDIKWAPDLKSSVDFYMDKSDDGELLQLKMN